MKTVSLAFVAVNYGVLVTKLDNIFSLNDFGSVDTRYTSTSIPVYGRRHW